MLRQPTLQVAARFDVVAAKTGQILYQHAADAPAFHVPQHPLKGGALEIRAGIAVIGVAFRRGQIRVVFDVLLQQLPLVADGVALHPVAVLPGQAAVQRGGQRSLLHTLPPFRGLPQPSSRLCVGADEFQNQRFRCLLTEKIAGDDERRLIG